MNSMVDLSEMVRERIWLEVENGLKIVHLPEEAGGEDGGKWTGGEQRKREREGERRDGRKGGSD